MRTQEQIVAMMRNPESDDFMGTKRNDLLFALEYQHAKEWLKPETTEENWNKSESRTRTDLDVIREMRDYMPFAWEKANNERGLSAGRTMNHYWAWLWLIGQDELAASTEEYDHYGKPQLARICRFLDLDPKTWDDGER